MSDSMIIDRFSGLACRQIHIYWAGVNFKWQITKITYDGQKPKAHIDTQTLSKPIYNPSISLKQRKKIYRQRGLTPNLSPYRRSVRTLGVMSSTHGVPPACHTQSRRALHFIELFHSQIFTNQTNYLCVVSRRLAGVYVLQTSTGMADLAVPNISLTSYKVKSCLQIHTDTITQKHTHNYYRHIQIKSTRALLSIILVALDVALKQFHSFNSDLKHHSFYCRSLKIK